VALVTAVPLVALGITYSRPVEVSGALLLAAALVLYALVVLTNLSRVEPMARFFLCLSTAAVLATMTLATLYATREWGNWPQWDTALLARWHGSLNAFGFVWCGLLAWTLEEGRSRHFRDISKRDSKVLSSSWSPMEGLRFELKRFPSLIMRWSGWRSL
jgi:hypothetical protein